MLKESYRPICILHLLEKVFEGHLNTQLKEHLERNNILHDRQHGGRKNRSTMTAKTVIDNFTAKNYEEGKTISIISSDLSLALDTVDTCILLNKMKFYGIWKRENKFFCSYLQERTQYIELQTKKSTVWKQVTAV